MLADDAIEKVERFEELSGTESTVEIIHSAIMFGFIM